MQRTTSTTFRCPGFDREIQCEEVESDCVLSFEHKFALFYGIRRVLFRVSFLFIFLGPTHTLGFAWGVILGDTGLCIPL